MPEPRIDAFDVLIVGGGPAGLGAAMALRSAGVERVVVAEREVVAGGVPRHCAHPGFGLRDRRRAWSGPTYARRLVEDALSAGVDLRTGTMVTDWAARDEDAAGGAPGPAVPDAWVTSPLGRARACLHERCGRVRRQTEHRQRRADLEHLPRRYRIGRCPRLGRG